MTLCVSISARTGSEQVRWLAIAELKNKPYISPDKDPQKYAYHPSLEIPKKASGVKFDDFPAFGLEVYMI